MPKHCEIILYQDDGWTTNRIQDVLDLHTMIKKYAYILHDRDLDNNGSLKKAHYHVYMHFGQGNASLESVAKWYGVSTSYVAKIKSNQYLILKYYLHDNIPNKHQYAINDMICNFDLSEFFMAHEQKTSLDDIINQCAKGIITPYNFPEHISPAFYAKHETQIKRAWDYADQQCLSQNQGQIERQIIWVWGSNTGVGKTTLCRRFCMHEQLPVYIAPLGNDPFGRYAGQDAVILDDFRPYNPYSFNELLRLIDPHFGDIIHSRYRDKVLRCSILFVTSMLSPQETIRQYHLPSYENSEQLYRRITSSWHVDTDTITIAHYDLAQHNFIVDSIEKNPITDIKATSSQNTFDSASVIRSMLSSRDSQENCNRKTC